MAPQSGRCDVATVWMRGRRLLAAEGQTGDTGLRGESSQPPTHEIGRNLDGAELLPRRQHIIVTRGPLSASRCCGGPFLRQGTTRRTSADDTPGRCASAGRGLERERCAASDYLTLRHCKLFAVLEWSTQCRRRRVLDGCRGTSRATYPRRLTSTEW